MQMTGYELLANYEKAEDKDKQIQILADLNHIPVDMVCFVIDRYPQKNFQSGVRRNLTVWIIKSMHRKYIIEKFAMYTELQVHTGKGVQNREKRIHSRRSCRK